MRGAYFSWKIKLMLLMLGLMVWEGVEQEADMGQWVELGQGVDPGPRWVLWGVDTEEVDLQGVEPGSSQEEVGVGFGHWVGPLLPPLSPW